MTTIEISDETYQHLLSYATKLGVPETSLSELADAKIRQAVGSPSENPSSGEELIASFREFRGAMRDTTLEDIVADRHRGLR